MLRGQVGGRLALHVPDVLLLRCDVALVVVEGCRVGHLLHVRVLRAMQTICAFNQLPVVYGLGGHRNPCHLLCASRLSQFVLSVVLAL